MTSTAVLLVICNLALAVQANSVRAEEITRQSATGACMLFIQQRLHDPESADFGHSQDASVSIKGNRAIVVRTVRAKNGFGAMRLEEFMCFLEVNNGMITPALVIARGESPAKATALSKKWKMP